jgi:large subunit ribosomal protein L9e
MAAKYNISNI